MVQGTPEKNSEGNLGQSSVGPGALGLVGNEKTYRQRMN